MRTALFALTMTALTAFGAARAEEKVVYAITTTNISVGQADESSIPRKLGFWKKDGLDVDVIGVAGATMGIQQVISGQADATFVGVDGLFLARAKGIKVKAFYTAVQRPIYQIVALKGNGITKIEDLKGKTIGVPDMSTGAVAFTRAILKRSNIDPDNDVKWLSVGYGGPAANALRQKSIDVWAAWDTIVAALENNGFEFNQIVPEWATQIPGNVLIASEDTIAKHPDRIMKLARGIAQSSTIAIANPKAAILNHWQMYPETKPESGDIDKELANAEHIFNSRFDLIKLPPGVTQWGLNDDAKWKALAELYIEQGLLPKDFDYKAAYTNALIDDINKFDRGDVEKLSQRSSW
jgi:NitT/TauT family transport system substrate-binding protein